MGFGKKDTRNSSTDGQASAKARAEKEAEEKWDRWRRFPTDENERAALEATERKKKFQ